MAMFAFILLTILSLVHCRSLGPGPLQSIDVSSCGISAFDMGKLHRSRRHAVSDRTLLWESGVVPYELDRSISNFAKLSIRYAMKMLQSKTCIQFKQRERSDAHFVKFISGKSCWSYIGRRILPGKSYQDVSLAPYCVTKGVALHEIMHLLGFYHEHTRFDRNRFINILWDNIDPAHSGYFQPVNPSSSNFDHNSYDYNSIMQYDNLAFSINGKPTMEVKNDPKRLLGRKDSLSRKDVENVKKLYNCQKRRSAGVWGDWSPWGKCIGNNMRMRLRKCTDDVVPCPNAYFDGFQIQKESCSTATSLNTDGYLIPS